MNNLLEFGRAYARRVRIDAAANRQPAGRPGGNFERRAGRCQPLRCRGVGRGAHEARVRDTAVREERMIAAERLAEQSRAEAELASAKTAAAKAKAVNDEMKRSTSTLIEEMQRSSEEKP